MESITRTLGSADDNTSLPIQPNVFQEKPPAFLRTTAAAWDAAILGALHRWSIPALRLALGVVFVWFGALKVFGVSPVTPMLRETYTFMAGPGVPVFLGVIEMVVCICL